MSPAPAAEPGTGSGPDSSPRSAGRLGPFAALRHPGYRYVWLGVVSYSGGQWMEQVALGWLVYQLTDSAFLLGAVSGLRILPFLFSPVAGVLADRIDRKRLMLASQFVVVAFYVGLVSLLAVDLIQVWHVFVFTLGIGLAWSINQPARHSLIPDLVPPEDLVSAVALQSLAHNVTRILGPAAGGVLMASLGPTATFALVAATLGGVLLTTFLIPDLPRSAAGRAHGRGSVWQDLGGGFGLVWRDRLLRGLMLLGLAPMVAGMSYMGLAPLFARDVFGLTARGAGELLGASGVGAVIGALTTPSLAAAFRARGPLILTSGTCVGLALMAFAFSPWYPLALAWMVAVGFSSMSYFVLSHASIQLATPRDYMGRVMSISMLDRGLMPLGTFAAGALAQAFGGPAAIALMGAACSGLVALGALTLPEVRRLR